ncbi:MAG: helix-hairpin-helix domain-containing protein [Acidaminococcaceae bacterium]
MNLFEKKKLLVIVVLIIILAALSIWQSTPGKLEGGVIEGGEQLSESKTKGLTVYVSGEVKKPGMYEMPAGSRAKEAIEKAGGMTINANVNKVNLAKKCKDGMQINVPALSVKQAKIRAGSSQIRKSAGSVNSAKVERENLIIVNLNSADIEELKNLPGVGQTTAQKIIEYRQQHRFEKIEEIMNIKGIGKAKFQKMKDYLEI